MTIKKRITISTSIVVILTGLIIYFIILPTMQDIKKISNDVYIERVDLEKKYLRGQLLKKTIEDFERIKPEEDKLNSVFIIEGEELKFITALEKIAIFHSLKQDIRLQPNQDPGSGFYYTLPLEIMSRGEFVKILKYLQDLEKLNYYFNISSIVLSADNQNDDAVTIILKGETYVLPAKIEKKYEN